MSPLDQHFSDEPSLMSFGEHLDELRNRLIVALIAPVILSILAFFVADWIIEALCLPVRHALAANGLPIQMQALDPAEPILTQFKLAIIAAVVLSAPWILWQAWKFIQPGLHAHERRFVYFLIPGSAVLTLAGMALLYWVMLPLMLQVLISLSVNDEIQIRPPPTPPVASAPAMPSMPLLAAHPSAVEPGQMWVKMPEQLLCVATTADADGVVHVLTTPLSRGSSILPQYRLREYIDFVLILALGVAVAFQMPLVILLLGWIGIIEARDLTKYRRHALFACGVLSAVITPSGDLFSLLIMMAPLYGLYELGVLLLRVLPAHRLASGELFPKPRFLSSHKGTRAPARGDSPAHPAGSIARRESQHDTRRTDADEEADP